MVAFVIVGIVLTSAVALYSVNVYTNDMVTRRNTALTIARSQIDYLRTLDYSSLPNAIETATNVNPDGETVPVHPDAATLKAGVYLRTTEITAGNAGDTYKNVRVTVVCPAKARRPAVTITLSTSIMNRSLVTNMQ